MVAAGDSGQGGSVFKVFVSAQDHIILAQAS